jgi:hypothetical protein
MSKMNWSRTRFAGRPTLDYRRERDLDRSDQAARWLQVALSRQPSRRSGRRPSRVFNTTAVSTVPLDDSWITVNSSSEVPW